jgi:hypothetical protein
VLGNAAVWIFVTVIVSRQAQGYLALVLFNVFMVLALLVTTQSLELRDLRRRTGRLGAALRLRAGSVFVLAAIVAVTCASVGVSWAPLAASVR